jgi:hypothetical protein
MSACELVAVAEIDALVSFAADQRLKWIVPGDIGLTDDDRPLTLSSSSQYGRTTIGKILIEQHARAVAATTSSDSPKAAAAYAAVESYKQRRYPIGLIDAHAVVGLARRYEEQARRSDTWGMSLAEWIILRILGCAAQSLA